MKKRVRRPTKMQNKWNKAEKNTQRGINKIGQIKWDYFNEQAILHWIWGCIWLKRRFELEKRAVALLEHINK